MRRGQEILGAVLAAVLLASAALGGLSTARAQEQEKEKPKAAETEKGKKKPAKSAAREPGRPLDTRAVLSRTLRHFTDGFEALSPSTVRDWVLEDKFYDYPRFEEGVTVFLRSVGEMRLFTREVNVQVEGDRAVMIVEVEMVFAPRQATGPSERRRERVTFDFQRTPEGWVITEINPRSFFLP